MSENVNKIKDILLSLEKEYGPLDNKDTYSILNKFTNVDSALIIENEIVKEYNRLRGIKKNTLLKVEEYNNSCGYDNSFFYRGIYTINDLYKYMNDNFEYGGCVKIDNVKYKLPFGPINGVAKYNILNRYQDKNVFNFVVDFYNKMYPNNEIIKYVQEQYLNKDVDICLLKEYQQMIFKVSEYIQTNIWRQRTIEEILNDQISNCYESSFLVGEFLHLQNIKYQKYIIGRYDNMALAHMFITYNIEGKYYYFEHALRDFKGIYEYNSKEDMEQDIFVKFIYNDNYKMEQHLNLDNYFLKPIDDLDPSKGFPSYFEYFSTIKSIRLRKRNYNILLKMTDLVLKEILNIGIIYTNSNTMCYIPISLPLQTDYYDIELWNKKVFQILRKNMMKICFYHPYKEETVFTLNPQRGFVKYNNMIIVDGTDSRMQSSPCRIEVNNMYTISDLEKIISLKDVTKTKDILMFSSLLEDKKDLYEYGCHFATNLSKDCIKIIDHNTEDLCTYSDICLSGNINNKTIGLSNDNFLEQITIIGSSIEIINKAIELVVNKDYRHDLINTFVDYLIYMLDVETVDIDKIRNDTNFIDSDFSDELVTKLLSELFDKREKTT